MWHLFQDGGAIKSTTLTNCSNSKRACNIPTQEINNSYTTEIVPSYKPNAFCNVNDIFTPYTFLMKRQILEKLLKQKVRKHRNYVLFVLVEDK